MTGNSIALDTNQVIALFANGDIAKQIQSFSDIWLPVPVIGELMFGAINSARPAENLQRISELTLRCQIAEMSRRTAEIYANVRFDLKTKGRPIPENDVWIAALCIERAIPLATLDRHFGEVTGLQLFSNSTG